MLWFSELSFTTLQSITKDCSKKDFSLTSPFFSYRDIGILKSMHCSYLQNTWACFHCRDYSTEQKDNLSVLQFCNFRRKYMESYRLNTLIHRFKASSSLSLKWTGPWIEKPGLIRLDSIGVSLRTLVKPRFHGVL